MAWYQWMSHYGMIPIGMIPMHVTLWHDTNECSHTMGLYQCISRYGTILMHVTLWHDTNACHIMTRYQCMLQYVIG